MEQKNKPLKRKISEKKISAVKERSELIKKSRTIMIASIKNLPSSQFQEISKKLRSKAVIKVPKKNLIVRAVDSLKDENLKKIKDNLEESTAILFSDMDSFELASELLESKSPAGAKAGQKAPEDIEIPEGPTDLVPGPAISELGALEIQIQIDKGKISIKEPKTIVKKGGEISENAANIMNKLDIKPFSVGFVPLTAFDTKENILYLEIKINKEETIKELKKLFRKSLAFAVETGYASDDTIKLLIGKAGRQEKAIENIFGKGKKAGKNSSEEQAQTQEINSGEEKN